MLKSVFRTWAVNLQSRGFREDQGYHQSRRSYEQCYTMVHPRQTSVRASLEASSLLGYVCSIYCAKNLLFAVAQPIKATCSQLTTGFSSCSSTLVLKYIFGLSDHNNLELTLSIIFLLLSSSEGKIQVCLRQWQVWKNSCCSWSRSARSSSRFTISC